MAGRKQKYPGIRERNGWLYAAKVITVGGKKHRIYRSLQTCDWEIAELKLRALEKEIIEAELYGVAPDISFEEAATRYLDENGHLKSIERAAIALANMVPEIGSLMLREIHDETLAPYKRKRLEEDGVTPGTLNRELAIVRRILNLAARKWRKDGKPMLQQAPLLSMAKDNGREAHILSRAEEQKLADELGEHTSDALLFALNTGLRASEQAQLKWSDEHHIPELALTVFLIRDGKTKNARRVVPLNAEARRIVEKHRGNGSDYVFAYKGEAVTRFNTNAFRKARRKVGLGDFRWHDARHTFASRLRACDVDHETRATLLGHAGGTMTAHYSATGVKTLQDAVDQLDDTVRADVVLATIAGHVADESAVLH